MSTDLPFGVPGGAWVHQVPEPAPRQYPEDELQRACCEFLAVALPSDAMYFHCPNGGKRHAREAARLRAIGTKAGIPDLIVVHRGRVLFVELKAGRGVLSAAQKAMHRLLVYCGAEVMLVRSVAQLDVALRECGVHLRASVMA